jgi:hypothetical protein
LPTHRQKPFKRLGTGGHIGSGKGSIDKLTSRIGIGFAADPPVLVRVPRLRLAADWPPDVVLPMLVDDVHNLICLDWRS